MYKLSEVIILIFAILISFGCTASNTSTIKANMDLSEFQDFIESKPDKLKPISKRLLNEGKNNEVLNLMRMGLNAMQLEDFANAKWAFDNAISGIEKIYANSDQALRARSLWVEEGSKIFKGEPYERVMTYYYRGLLDIQDSDLQNARASFRGGMLQDAFAEEEQHRCDFAILLYLSGWCGQRITDDMLHKYTFEEFKKLRPDIPIPDAKDNVLILVETGKSPRKLSDGVGHYQLKIRKGRQFSDKHVRLKINEGASILVHPVEDIYWQASTRGGRQFDSILAGKANFKKQTASFGDATGKLGTGSMMAATIFESSASELQAVGAGIGLISVMSQVASSRTKTEADTRYWDNLPDQIHIASVHLPPGNHSLRFEFLDESGQLLDALTRETTVSVAETTHTLLWLNSHQQIIE